jgi:hypothetical protein
LSALSERARLAAIKRHHPDRLDLAADAKRDLAAANLEAYIKRIVTEAPPLTEDQRSRLALLLRGPSGSGDAVA